MNTKEIKIGIVLVTFNRLQKLQVALDCFEKQSHQPAYVLVVDNASTDGTGEYLKQWRTLESNYEKIVLSQNTNLGGSGGFHTGLAAAVNMAADWIWVSDDDAFPEPDALAQIRHYLSIQENSEKFSAICGAVINNGKFDLAHRRRYFHKGSRIDREDVPESEYACDSFSLNAFSYVGTVLRKGALSQAGLTNKDFFIWYDDTEHSLRLSKYGSIICLPKVRIHHDQPDGAAEYSWKDYYGIRNKLYMYKTRFPVHCRLRQYLHTLRTIIGLSICSKDRTYVKLYCRASFDAMIGKLGQHKLYRPGWKKS